MTRVLFDLSVLRSDSRLRGIGRYAGDLGRGLGELASDGLDIIALTNVSLTGRIELDRDLAAAQARLVTPGAPMWSYREWATRMRVTLPFAARAAKADVTHSGHPAATPLLPVRGKRIVTCHDLIPLRMPAQYVTWRQGGRWGQMIADRRRYESADHVIAVSQATADDLVRILGLSARKITVVLNGVDIGRWLPTPEPSDVEVATRYGLEGRPFVLYVGAGDYRKNVEGMLETVRIARERPGGGELLFVWAGAISRRLQKRLDAWSAARALESAVKILGHVPDEDLAALYRQARALLFLSRCEGFGYPIVEAMASGCPVVTCPDTSTGEIAGRAALLSHPDDHGAAAHALMTVVLDDQERARRREAGIARAAELSLDRMARSTAEVYRAVAG
jgi:glycosyltransferase involved in cell wall biosynthesis